ncbi:hypothetical protein [Leptolyngbya sp. NIES-2104]|uniref:hypothetical protein n=1 Tax=Leptolyngbya sp. NIES-2104 TaxID=1552121 RepID=UPI0006ECC078|nr:hypothetical protein [Leptolyngbya sp. NIES-2104]GAP98866.1 predicted membrane protein/domain [Leptolyngbya sp. NIES-2104]
MVKFIFAIASLPVGFALSLNLVPSASAQVVIRSTGVVTGTVVPPSQNPNFNQGTTRVDVDAQGRFFRNGQLVYSAQDFDPRLVQTDGNGRYWVDFRGILIVSTDGTLTSPVLSNGELEPIRRNHNAPTRFHGTIQDELVVRGKYAGIATDPTTGLQYQGTFDISGQGPRYSDRNGGTSPTVFDFRSHYNFRANPQIPPRPTVNSFRIDAMPVRLTVTIPTDLAPIQLPPVAPGDLPTPIVPPVVPPVSNPISPLPISPDADPGGILSTNQIQQVSRVVLEGSQAKPPQIGPSSRILLR